jgi:serine protease
VADVHPRSAKTLRLGALALVLVLAACGGADAPGSISGTIVFPGDVVGPSTSPRPDTPDVGPAPLRTDADEAEIVPGQVIVRFAPGVARAATTLRVAGVSLTLERSAGGGAFSVYRAPNASEAQTRALVAQIGARADVAAAFPNWILRAFKAPDDPNYAYQWHYPAINLPLAWDAEDGTTNDVVVAVLDTGIIDHPDLLPSLLPGYDFVDRDDDPRDPGGASAFHGTHVAGTVGAATDNALGVAGVSWGANVLPVRVLDGDGVGTTLGIIDGIAWAAGVPTVDQSAPTNANPARIINLSLGGTVPSGCPPEYDDFFASIVALDIVIVAAAGNANVNAASTFPAHCSNVVAVGATGPLGTRAPYSNYGTTIDLMAPGGDISRTFTVGSQTFPAGVLSTTGVIDDGTLYATYAFYQGTSMAAPHVAGVMALMLSADPELTPAQLLTRLSATATPLSALECQRPSDDQCGAGLIDAAAALAFESGDVTPAPPRPPSAPGTVPTYVVAFYCVAVGSDPCGDVDLDRSGEAVVPTTSNEVSYAVSGLVPGTYLAVAWQDLNQNVVVDDGEPIGIHPNLIAVGAGQARTGVRIVMAPWEPLGAAHQPVGGRSPERIASALQRWVDGER